jgi:hypothetical protein
MLHTRLLTNLRDMINDLPFVMIAAEKAGYPEPWACGYFLDDLGRETVPMGGSLS